MTAMTTGQTAVRLERTIPATPHRVYRAWLEPELLRRWMAPGGLEVTRAEVDERPGGHYRIWQADAGTEIGGFDQLRPNCHRHSVPRPAIAQPRRRATVAHATDSC